MSHSKSRAAVWGRRSTVLGCVAAALGCAALAAPAGADVSIYSNVDNFTANAVSATGSPAVSGGADYTQLVADDITPAAGYVGKTITSVIFSLYNGSPDTVTFIPELRFYAADGAASGGTPAALPGSLLFGENTAPVTLLSGQTALEQLQLPTTGTVFTVPTGTFYAGLAFTDGGTTGISADDLAALGQLTYDPPTVGSSADSYFQSTGTGPFTSVSPAGSLGDLGHPTDPTQPVANFGWAFTVASPVPEPASAGLLAGIAGAALSRRRNKR